MIRFILPFFHKNFTPRAFTMIGKKELNTVIILTSRKSFFPFLSSQLKLCLSLLPTDRLSSWQEYRKVERENSFRIKNPFAIDILGKSDAMVEVDKESRNRRVVEEQNQSSSLFLNSHPWAASLSSTH
jgi:hypothetical protein